jgi:hypothetical protein
MLSWQLFSTQPKGTKIAANIGESKTFPNARRDDTDDDIDDDDDNNNNIYGVKLFWLLRTSGISRGFLWSIFVIIAVLHVFTSSLLNMRIVLS